MPKKRTEITIETERRLIISNRQTSASAWCASCGAQVQMIRADEAAYRACVSSRVIYGQIEKGTLHFLETVGGLLLICLNSLSTFIKRMETD